MEDEENHSRSEKITLMEVKEYRISNSKVENKQIKRLNLKQKIKRSLKQKNQKIKVEKKIKRSLKQTNQKIKVETKNQKFKV